MKTGLFFFGGSVFFGLVFLAFVLVVFARENAIS